MSYDWDIHQEPYLLKLIHFSKRDPHHTEIKVKPSDHVYPIDPKNKTMFECIAVKEIIFCQLPCDALLLLNSLHKASYISVILKFNFKTRKNCLFIWNQLWNLKKHSSNQCYQVFLIHKMHPLILLTIYPLELQGARMVRG